LIAWLWKSPLEKTIDEILLDINTDVQNIVQGHPEMNMREILTYIAKRRRMPGDLDRGYSWEGLFLATVITMVGRMFSNHPRFGTQKDYVTVEIMTAQLVVNRGGNIDNMIRDLPGIYNYR
jgi:hypothetical protein